MLPAIKFCSVCDITNIYTNCRNFDEISGITSGCAVYWLDTERR